MKIRIFLHLLTRFHWIRQPIFIFRFRLKGALDNIYLLFLNIRSPWYVLVPILFTVEQTRPAKSYSI